MELQQTPGFETEQSDLELLLPLIEQWAYGLERHWQPGEQDSSGEGGYLGGFFLLRVFPGQQENAYPPPVVSEVIQPLWAMYRGKMLIWAAIENALLSDSFYARGQELLALAAAAYQKILQCRCTWVSRSHGLSPLFQRMLPLGTAPASSAAVIVGGDRLLDLRAPG